MYILNYSWAVWLAWLLGAFFLVNGVLNLAGLKAMKEGFAQWGYPRWFHLINGALNVLIGLAILWYPTRILGLFLSVLLCVAVWITLVRHRDFRHLPSSIVLFVVTLLTAWGLRLI